MRRSHDQRSHEQTNKHHSGLYLNVLIEVLQHVFLLLNVLEFFGPAQSDLNLVESCRWTQVWSESSSQRLSRRKKAWRHSVLSTG